MIAITKTDPRTANKTNPTIAPERTFLLTAMLHCFKMTTDYMVSV